MTTPSVTSGTPYVGIPNVTQPFVEPNGLTILPPWHRLLIALWARAGGSQVQTGQAAYLVYNPDGTISVYTVGNNVLVGKVLFVPTKGGATRAIALGTSPSTYEATELGNLQVASGEVEISRDGGTTFFLLSRVGGYFAAEPQDLFRLTWFGEAPQVTFFPYS